MSIVSNAAFEQVAQRIRRVRTQLARVRFQPSPPDHEQDLQGDWTLSLHIAIAIPPT
jgi:hypothetical protein